MGSKKCAVLNAALTIVSLGRDTRCREANVDVAMFRHGDGS